MSGEVAPNVDPHSKQLQDNIQLELIKRGWSIEGDDVMVTEFIFVMLCNKKTPVMIEKELEDLVAQDFQPDFIPWLFEAVEDVFPNSSAAKNHGPKAKQAAEATAAAAAAAAARDAEMQQQSPDRRDGRTDRRASNRRDGQRNVWGNAVAGVKRPSEGGNPPSQRQRRDQSPVHDAPRGPRSDNRRRSNDGSTNLIDRVGPPQQHNNMQHMPNIAGGMPVMSPMGPAIYNPATGQLLPVQMPDMNAGNNQRRGGRNQNQNHQQFQQPYSFFPMQNQNFPPQSFQNGFNPAAGQDSQQQPVPTKPLDDGLCKYATECTNAYCKYAHPSPAATKETGLVLSAEVCDKQLECEDQDCPKSHVSPQAKDPSSSRAPPVQDTAGIPRSKAPPPPQINYGPQGYGPAAGKPCKFGTNCTRPDCAFSHPWNSTPCRFGAACSRPGCHFSHPPGHNPYRSAGRGGPPKGNKTAVFNTAAAIGEKLKETEAEKEALSQRMKKFSVDSNGQQSTNGSAEAASVKAETS